MSTFTKAQSLRSALCVHEESKATVSVSVGLLLGIATENSRRRRQARARARARRSHDEHCPRAWRAASRCPVHGARCMSRCLHYTIRHTGCRLPTPLTV